MPMKPDWLKAGARVITPDGYGVITRPVSDEVVKVHLDVPVAGMHKVVYGPGQITLDTPHSVFRVINISGFGLLSSVVNYPADEACTAALDYPFVQDETLTYVNFETREVFLYRTGTSLLDKPYIILSGYFDLHAKADCLQAPNMEIALHLWERNFGVLSGVTGHIMLAALITFADMKKPKVLARKLLSTMAVLKDDKWY